MSILPFPRTGYAQTRYPRENDPLIHPVQVISETEKTITYQLPNERPTRMLKPTNGYFGPIYDTWEECRQAMLNTARYQREFHSKKAAEATDRIQALLDLKAP